MSCHGSGDVFAPGDALRTAEILYADGESHRRDVMRRLLLSLGARRVQVAESAAKLYERIGWAISDSRPFEVKDGHYVIEPAQPKLPAGVPSAAVAAATK